MSMTLEESMRCVHCGGRITGLRFKYCSPRCAARATQRRRQPHQQCRSRQPEYCPQHWQRYDKAIA